MKNLLLGALIMMTCLSLQAQNKLNKGNATIRFEGSDSWNQNRFLIAVYKTGNSAKITYAYSDSANYVAVRQDQEYQRIKKRASIYKYDDPKRQPYADTIRGIIEKFRPYVRDSVVINLKTDTAYAYLINRFTKVTKEELQPKIKRLWTDGYDVIINIQTADKTLEADADTPTAKNHPSLIIFLRACLNHGKKSEPVKKILGSYSDFN